tara:strand:+ start:551 stop:748 length:198 start_codon:yes stop_codon:yes gene_type:complete
MVNVISEDATITPKPVKENDNIKVMAHKLPSAVKKPAFQPDVTADVMQYIELGPGDAVKTNTASK